MSTDELDALAAVLSHQVKIVPTKVDAVDIIVRTPPSEVRAVALRLKRDGIEASFASTAVPSAATLRVAPPTLATMPSRRSIAEHARLGSTPRLNCAATPAACTSGATSTTSSRQTPSFGELVAWRTSPRAGVTGAGSVSAAKGPHSRASREPETSSGEASSLSGRLARGQQARRGAAGESQAVRWCRWPTTPELRLFAQSPVCQLTLAACR